MKLRFRRYVRAEVRQEARWYESRQAGLGHDFLGAIESALDRILDNPQLYQHVHLDIRRAPLERFPFGVYYILVDKEIHVLAVAHDARHPSVWRARR